MLHTILIFKRMAKSKKVMDRPPPPRGQGGRMAKLQSGRFTSLRANLFKSQAVGDI